MTETTTAIASDSAVRPEPVSTPSAEVTQSTATPPVDRPSWAQRSRRTLADVAPALVVYEAIRWFCLGVLYFVLKHFHYGYTMIYRLDTRFDAGWYVQIAQQGYDHALTVGPDGAYNPTDLAFFPLFPGMIYVIHAVTGLADDHAALLLSWVFGLVAAWGIFAVGRHVHSRKVGIVLVAIWAALPSALVESSAYTETLFTALCAWGLLAVMRRQWLLAAAFGLLAGLTRPNANAVILVVCVAALVALIRRQDRWRPLVPLLVAPLGYVGYLAWVGHRLGRLDGYTYADQLTWRVTFDFGVDTYDNITDILTKPGNDFGSYMVVFVVFVTLVLFALSVIDRQQWQLLLFSAVSLMFVLGAAGAFISKARYLVPVFPVLLPVAIGLAKARRSTMIVAVTTLVLLSAWYGVYLVLVWKWSP